MLELFFFRDPIPASRPRVSKWGTYYGKTYNAYRRDAEAAIPQAKSPLTGPLIVEVIFNCPRPKTSKREFPRGDIDNYLKAILDVITKKGYWEDDDQIVIVTAEKNFAEKNEEPCTQVYITQA